MKITQKSTFYEKLKKKKKKKRKTRKNKVSAVSTLKMNLMSDK